MIIESGISRMNLGRGEILKLHRAQGETIACVDGALWVTREHDIRDIVLGVGESTLVDGPGLVLIQAFEASQFVVGPAAAVSAPAQRKPTAARQALALGSGLPCAA